MKTYPALFVFLLLFGCREEEAVNPPETGLIVDKRAEPVLTNPAGLVSDPSVLRSGDTLWMYFSDYYLAIDSISFGAVKSVDGLSWEPAFSDGDRRVFSGDVSSWDKLIETPEVVEIDGRRYLYYIGYPSSALIEGIYQSEVGLAVAEKAHKFTRIQEPPVVLRGGALDEDAITSPAVVRHDGAYYMAYTGWTDILEAGGFLGLAGAVSGDGVNWVKHSEPVFEAVRNTEFETATEADLIRGPDGIFYLVFSAENGIALARSDHPFGPWEIYPEPIIRSEYDWESGEVVAPTALIENGKLRIWYTGVIGAFEGASIGYVEVDFPLSW